MITIRLSRTGKHKAPQYRIVVQDKHKDPWSPALEVLGHFNPRRNPVELVLNKERAQYWLSKGAQLSETVHNMFVDQGLIKAEKMSSVNISKKRQKTLADAKAEAEKAKAEAAAKAEAEKAAAAEAKRAAEEAAKAEAEAAKAAAEAAAAAPAEAPAAEATPEAPASEEAPAA